MDDTEKGKSSRLRIEEIKAGAVEDAKEMERGDTDSELKFRSLFELMPFGVAITDVAKGKILDANGSFCEMAKMDNAAVIGKTTVELGFFPEEARAELINELQASEEVRGIEMAFKSGDGTIVNTLVYAKVMWFERKSVILKILLDVSDRKRLEGKLQHAHKMELIGTLVGVVAHNFNNVLMGIQGNTALMLLKTEADHPNREKLLNIEKMILSGSMLTRQLLEYTRKGRYEVEPISMNDLVSETAETFAMTRKDIRVHKELDEGLLKTRANRGQIEQVLFNLYTNSAEAMSKGGDLFLRTRNITREDMTGKLYKAKYPRYVLLTVTDTGSGMDKETAARVFEPFFSTKSGTTGSGVGLAMCLGIVKAHDGYIDVYSKEGSGTTFEIYLPAAKKEAEAAEAARATYAAYLPEGSETILMIDDDDTILDVSKLMIQELGYNVLVARGGKAAIEIFENNADAIDMVILDMIMPDVDGEVVYEQMKAIKPGVRVLLSSGYSKDGKAGSILKRGCDGFIQKPFNMEKLSESIREILDG